MLGKRAVTPPHTPSCFSPGTTDFFAACYGEFPQVFPNGNHLFMIFTGQTQTPASLMSACDVLAGCLANYTEEGLVMDLGADTQNPSSGAVVRQMDSQIPGTPLNAAFLTSPLGGPGGIPGGNFGGCGHVEIDLPSSQLVCEFATNIGSLSGVSHDQTVVFPLIYPGSMIFPKTLLTGNASVTGNARIN